MPASLQFGDVKSHPFVKDHHGHGDPMTELKHLAVVPSKPRRRDLNVDALPEHDFRAKFEAFMQPIVENIEIIARALQMEISERCGGQERTKQDLSFADDRINELAAQVRQQVAEEFVLREEFKELLQRIEQEERVRPAADKRLEGRINDVVGRVHGVEEELARKESVVAEMNVAMQSFHTTIELESEGRAKAIDHVNRTLVQIRKDIDKEAHDRTECNDNVAAACKESQLMLQNSKQEQAASKEAIWKAITQQEHSCTDQCASLVNSIAALQLRVEEETKALRRSYESRLQERSNADLEISRRVKEVSDELRRQNDDREQCETTLRNQIATCWQTHMSEKDEAYASMRQRLQNIEALVEQQLQEFKVSLDSEVGERTHSYRTLDKRISELSINEFREAEERSKGDDEVMRFAMQAKNLVEKELWGRQTSEDALRQQVTELSAAFDQRVVATQQRNAQFEDLGSKVAALSNIQADDRRNHEHWTRELEELKKQLIGSQHLDRIDDTQEISTPSFNASTFRSDTVWGSTWLNKETSNPTSVLAS